MSLRNDVLVVFNNLDEDFTGNRFLAEMKKRYPLKHDDTFKRILRLLRQKGLIVYSCNSQRKLSKYSKISEN